MIIISRLHVNRLYKYFGRQKSLVNQVWESILQRNALCAIELLSKSISWIMSNLQLTPQRICEYWRNGGKIKTVSICSMQFTERTYNRSRFACESKQLKSFLHYIQELYCPNNRPVQSDSKMDLSLQYVEDIASGLTDFEGVMFNILKATLRHPASPPAKGKRLASDINFLCTSQEGDVDEILWQLWPLLLDIACCIPSDHSWQDSLLQCLNTLRLQDGAILNHDKVKNTRKWIQFLEWL